MPFAPYAGDLLEPPRLAGDPDASTTSGPASSSPERLDLFPIPVFKWRWSEATEMKTEIMKAIRERQHRNSGIKRTNRNGWHSEVDLPRWPEPAIQKLVSWVASCTQASTLRLGEDKDRTSYSPWRINGWANVNPAGGFNVAHQHAQRNWHWSACFYVHLGEIISEDGGGALVFHERRTGLYAKSSEERRSYRVVPREGELILFPSWLFHSVESHSSEDDRVSIAFNLHNRALERSRLWKYRPPVAWRLWPRLMERLAKRVGMADRGWDAPPAGTDVVL